MKVLFLDESGDHNFSNRGPQHSLFVLGGVIVELDYAQTVLTNALRDFKVRVFGRPDLDRQLELAWLNLKI